MLAPFAPAAAIPAPPAPAFAPFTLQIPTLAAQGDAAADTIVSPTLILILCLVAGVGTVMLLPSRREAPWRKVGGVVLLAAGLILAAMLVRATAGRVGPGAYFWIFSLIALAGAVRVVTHPRPVYSALYFVLTVFATAGLFILLWAEFMAAALVLIYAGAILVTYVFVIMLASQSTAPEEKSGAQQMSEYDAVSREPLVASAVGFALMGVLLFVIFDRGGAQPVPSPRGAVAAASAADDDATAAAATVPADAADPARVAPEEAPAARVTPAERETATGNTQMLGRYLFNNHPISLELAGLILTISMIGAILIARRRVVLPPQPQFGAAGAGPRDVWTAPATPVDDDPHSIPVFGTDNPRQKAYPET
jgi:NADH-quinone oxidoreductase subunit J